MELQLRGKIDFLQSQMDREEITLKAKKYLQFTNELLVQHQNQTKFILDHFKAVLEHNRQQEEGFDYQHLIASILRYQEQFLDRILSKLELSQKENSLLVSQNKQLETHVVQMETKTNQIQINEILADAQQILQLKSTELNNMIEGYENYIVQEKSKPREALLNREEIEQ